MTVKVFRYTKTSQNTDRTEREKEREVSLETTNERGDDWSFLARVQGG